MPQTNLVPPASMAAMRGCGLLPDILFWLRGRWIDMGWNFASINVDVTVCDPHCPYVRVMKMLDKQNLRQRSNPKSQHSVCTNKQIRSNCGNDDFYGPKPITDKAFQPWLASVEAVPIHPLVNIYRTQQFKRQQDQRQKSECGWKQRFQGMSNTDRAC